MKRSDNRNGEKRYKFYFPSFLQGIYSKFGLGALFGKKTQWMRFNKTPDLREPESPGPQSVELGRKP